MVLKIVTSIYELNYENLRGGGVYKGFQLLTETIRALIFDEYNYVIYTDKYTYDKHNLSEVFKHPNITIKFQELNSEFLAGNFIDLNEIDFSNIVGCHQELALPISKKELKEEE